MFSSEYLCCVEERCYLIMTVRNYVMMLYITVKNIFNCCTSDHQTEIAVLSGSTHILTPRRLLDEVKSLNKPKDTVCIKDEQEQ